MLGLIDGSIDNGGHSSKVTFDTTNIIGLIVWLLCILYNCINSAVEVSKINNDGEKRGKASIIFIFKSIKFKIH